MSEQQTPGGPIPKAPKGYQTCNVHDGSQDLWAEGATRQVNHLVVVPTSGPTLCGLTRFGKSPDLPGWSMGGGVAGGDVVQVKCEECWEAALTVTPTTIGEAMTEAMTTRRGQGRTWGPGVFFDLIGIDPETPITALRVDRP